MLQVAERDKVRVGMNDGVWLEVPRFVGESVGVWEMEGVKTQVAEGVSSGLPLPVTVKVFGRS